MEIFGRDTEWRSQFEKVKIRDMEDTHVVNVLHMVLGRIESLRKSIKEFKKEFKGDSELVETTVEYRKDLIDIQVKLSRVLKREMTLRKIPKELLDQAPIPFKKEGKTYKWQGKRSQLIPNSVKFIKDE